MQPGIQSFMNTVEHLFSRATNFVDFRDFQEIVSPKISGNSIMTGIAD